MQNPEDREEGIDNYPSATYIHPHGEHDCYCPVCGTTITVGEGVQCYRLDCPNCGTRMRAVDIGERRI